MIMLLLARMLLWLLVVVVVVTVLAAHATVRLAAARVLVQQVHTAAVGGSIDLGSATRSRITHSTTLCTAIITAIGNIGIIHCTTL